MRNLILRQGRCRFGALLAIALLAMAVSPERALAQTSAAPQVSPAQQVSPAEPLPAVQPAPQPAPRENPGLINEIGKLFQAPGWTLPAMPKLKSPSEAMDDWNKQAKNVTDSLQGIGSSSVVKGRMVCPVTGHGAPDCKAASDNLCKSKGFKEGKSLDTDSARTCSPQALLTGRKLEEGDCKTENYVTRALCQ